jgi:hypothetical protein
VARFTRFVRAPISLQKLAAQRSLARRAGVSFRIAQGPRRPCAARIYDIALRQGFGGAEVGKSLGLKVKVKFA